MSSEYVEDEAVMELSDLTLGDGGDITLTARHPGGDVDMTFELIVLSECIHVHVVMYTCKSTYIIHVHVHVVYACTM